MVKLYLFAFFCKLLSAKKFGSDRERDEERVKRVKERERERKRER